MKEMLEAVRKFHEKHDFKNTGGENMLYRMNIIMEEIGEICECLTKGKNRDQLVEEHADLLILLLGNCIALDVKADELEEAFWKKYDVIMKRKAKFVDGIIRVTDG